jgi:hypothetical protein
MGAPRDTIFMCMFAYYVNMKDSEKSYPAIISGDDAEGTACD